MKRLLILFLLLAFGCTAILSQRTDWEPPIPKDLQDLKHFAIWKMEYKRDPMWGWIEDVQCVEGMNWQLKRNGVIKGDCEDYAIYISYMLRRMGYKSVRKVGIPKYRHYLCVFRTDEGLRYFSGWRCLSISFVSVEEVVTHWCKTRGYKPTKLYVVF